MLDWRPDLTFAVHWLHVKTIKTGTILDGYFIGRSCGHIWSLFEAELGSSASPLLLFSSAMIRTYCWPCMKASFMHGVSDEEYIKNAVKMSKFNFMKQKRKQVLFSSRTVLSSSKGNRIAIILHWGVLQRDLRQKDAKWMTTAPNKLFKYVVRRDHRNRLQRLKRVQRCFEEKNSLPREAIRWIYI